MVPAETTAAPVTIKPRWPGPYPMTNGTSTTSSSTPKLPGAIQETPKIPEPIYEGVKVVPASEIPPQPTHPPVPKYVGSAAKLLQGYCSEPAYSIIDGPTAVWIPIVGCISSKADCCPTPTGDGGAPEHTSRGGDSKQSGGKGANGIAGGALFPKSLLPSQGTLTGCPKDYHTVGGTACCPSAYWLWSTTLGGQVPCYSSLGAKLKPPPIPDSLVDDGAGITTTGSGSHASVSTAVPAQTMTRKPTLAIVNVAFSMQYPMVSEPEPRLTQSAKIGIGVGVSGAGVLLIALIWILVRKCRAHRQTRSQLADVRQTDVSYRFGSSVDMSRVAHEPAGMGRTYAGKKYTGVASTNY